MNGDEGGCSSGVCNVTEGRGVGDNLFHRFSKFDTRGGIERVNIDNTVFISPDFSVYKNVILGVIDPLGSFIDKPIELRSPGNLFWLSPGGISISGSGGFQNVQNLNLSTATGLQFSGGNVNIFDVVKTTSDQIVDDSNAFYGSPVFRGFTTDPNTLTSPPLGLSVNGSLSIVNGDLNISSGLLTVSNELLLDAQGGNVLLRSSAVKADGILVQTDSSIIVDRGTVLQSVESPLLFFAGRSISIDTEIFAKSMFIETGGLELGPLASLTATEISRPGLEGFTTTIDILTDAFVNRAGSDALNVQPGSRWLIESIEPRNSELGGLPFDFKEYGVCFNECPVSYPGNGLVYEVVPELNPVLGEVRKVYDGTANALISTLGFLGAPGDLIDGDFVGSADINNAFYLTAGTGLSIPDVGTGKRVQLFASNLQILAPVSPGRTAPVYGYVIPSATTPYVGDRGVITPKPLSVIGTNVESKIYDGTTAAVLRGGRLQGVVGSQDVGLIEAGSFITKNVSSSPIPVVSSSRLTGTANLSNYFLLQPSGLSGFINARQLTGTITVRNKDFDGTADATIASRSLNLDRVVAGDEVNYIGGIARFNNSDPGTNKLVTASGLGLSGRDAGNYLVNDNAETLASIRPSQPKKELERTLVDIAPISPQDPLVRASSRRNDVAVLPKSSSDPDNTLTPSIVITDTRSSVSPPFEGPDLVDGPDLALNISDLSFITLSLQQATASFVEGETAAQQDTANKLGLEDETIDPDGTRVENVQAMLRKMMCATRRDQTSPACREKS
ncbi:YDG domain-containing protein [Synechococcus sp. 1G10]|uniref:YDG domain-containing protein n=1 Tax=Synechococcus sp. 1G10 TaxID=2025605 RepID=UPI00117E2FD6|nr:YDG domain-containing protein [Synechococcus sp. 1G10]